MSDLFGNQQQQPQSHLQEIVGFVERITFQNPENGYTVLQLQLRGKDNLISVVGSFTIVQPGESLRCFGKWEHHLVHGRQFISERYQVEMPADVNSIKKYLGSGLIKGIGPAYAKKIVEKFGESTLDVIDQTPERLLEIDKIGSKRVEMIQSCWTEQKTIRQLMIFMQSIGVSPSFAYKVFKRFGNDSIAKIKENPYALAKDIHGIGFKSADQLAQKMGIEPMNPYRLESGIEYALSDLASAGHVCYPLDELISTSAEMLGVDPDCLAPSLEKLESEERIVKDELLLHADWKPCIWSRALFISEAGIAREIDRLRQANSPLRTIDTEKAIQWVQEKLGLTLAENQSKAVTDALQEKLLIITGGPGTGKSTITNAILTISSILTHSIILAAPTGRAAKRMSEITGRKASTIHSLLSFDFKAMKFRKNRETPLECDLIIIDETSMIDTYLMYSLLKAIPDHARVVLVGDVHQLPSVGPGNVLKDMIDSNKLPKQCLNQIFRQAAGSRIITNAHRINQGFMPETSSQSESDFFFIEAESPEFVLETISGLVTHRVPSKFRFHPIDDIQVLSPMRKGIIGSENLNRILQEKLNPSDHPLFRFGRRYHVGDKVMQIKNNYTKEVFNGDIGRVSAIDTEEESMAVLYDGREVIYELNDLDELVLAYSVSIHKYQGSECPVVIIPIHTTHFKMLFRNLLYTGVTRGKKLVILVGTKKALAIAVKNDEVKERYTGLKKFLSSPKRGAYL